MTESVVTASDWLKGIALSVTASMIGGASKLAIRKSWIMLENLCYSGYSDDLDARNGTVQSTLAEGAQYGVAGRSGYVSPRVRDEETALSSFVASTKRTGEVVYTKQDSGNCESQDSDYSDCCGVSCAEVELTRAGDEDGQGRKNSIHGDGQLGMNETEASSPQASARRRRRAYMLRLGGMVGMTFLNPLCCVLAMNYASPSILAPFSGLTLVWIVLFAELLIGERPHFWQAVAAGMIVLGEVIVAVWGDHTNDGDVTLDDLEQSYLDPRFHIFFAGVAVWMIILTLLMRSSEAVHKRFAWGASGGSITGLQNFLKDSLTVLKNVSHRSDLPWYFYVMALLAISSSFSGLLLLTKCMKRYDATFSACMFVASFVVSASIMAAVHYHTFEKLEGLSSYVMYPFGLGVLLSGTLILVQATKEGIKECPTDDDCRVGTLSADASIHSERVGTASYDMKRPLVSEAVSKLHQGEGFT